MSLDPELLKSMRKLAAMRPDEIDKMLRELASTSPEEWRLGINTIVLTMWIEHAATRQALLKFKRELMEALAAAGAPAGGAGAGAAAGAAPAGATAPIPPERPPAAVVGGVPPDAVGGGDQGQADAEAIMNAVAGPRGGGPPPAVVGGRPVAQPMPVVGGGGARLGADGTPITDPAQLDAEAIMDQVAGPR